MDTSTLEHIFGLSEAVDPEDIPIFSSPNLKLILTAINNELTLNDELFQEEFQFALDLDINASAINEIHSSAKTSSKKLKVVESEIFENDIALVELQNRIGKGAPDKVKGSIQSQILGLNSRLVDVENTRVTKDLINFLHDIKTNYGVGLQNLIAKICGILSANTKSALKLHHNFLQSWTEQRHDAVPGELLKAKLDNLNELLLNLQNQNQSFQFPPANSGPTNIGRFQYASLFATPNGNKGLCGSHTFQHPFGNMDTQPQQPRVDSSTHLLQEKWN